jgi:hypothetical protein
MIRAVRGPITFFQARLRSGTGVTVPINGDGELKSGTLALPDMATKEQRNVREEDLV